jgi:hypothetical protein
VVLGCVLGAVGYALWGWKLTTLSEGSQWPFIVLAGAGVGFLLGPSSTDAVNRSIDASYGEVTGITQTIRNYGSSLGLAVLGTILVTVNTNKVTDSLVGLGLPRDQAERATEALASRGSGGAASALENVPANVRPKVFPAIQHDFAEASQWVFYGMALTLLISLGVALFHPGGRVTHENTTVAAGGAG